MKVCSFISIWNRDIRTEAVTAEEPGPRAKVAIISIAATAIEGLHWIAMIRNTLLALMCCALSAAAQTPSSSRPWMNTALTPDQRADLVIQQLTLPEKIQLVHGIGWGPLRAGSSTPPDNNGGAGEVLGIPRLGIPSLQQADSAVGVRGTAKESRYATLLPSTLGATASWDPD